MSNAERPSQERKIPDEPIISHINGSTIEVNDVAQIVHYASVETATIYSDLDFEPPISMVRTTARVMSDDEQIGLDLRSTFDLADDHGYTDQAINSRFINYFTTPSDAPVDDIVHRPFDIHPAPYPGTFAITHNLSQCHYLLWLNHRQHRVVISNNLVLKAGSISAFVDPPSIHDISPAEQITSIMEATAYTADFLNGLNVTDPHDPRVRGIAHARTYQVGLHTLTGRKPAPPKSRAAQAPPIVDNPFAGIGRMFRQALGIPEESPPEGPSGQSQWAAQHGIEILNPKFAPSFEDVGGLHHAKRQLMDVALSFKHPELMEKWDAGRPSGILLYGPSSVGKTLVARAFGREIGADTWIIQGSNIYRKFLGESEAKIKEIFARARASKELLVMLIDEFESVVGITENPTSGGDNARNAVAGIFKQEMNAITRENPNVIVIGATNNRDAIDPSLIGPNRFNFLIYAGLPNQQERAEIAGIIIRNTERAAGNKDFKLFSDDVDPGRIAEITPEFSGGALAEVIRRLKLSRAMSEARYRVEPPPIGQLEIELEIDNYKRNG
jgi:AAA+ superfamily predicted ATPase